jgi:hypothetical protein
MTAEPNGNTWDRQTICTLVNDLIIANNTWAQIAAKLKEEDVHIRRGLHGSQAKTWTAWSTYAYYKGGPSEMKLDQSDWPTAPKAPKKAGPKKKKKKKAGPKKEEAPKKAAPKKKVLKTRVRKQAEREIRLRETRPANLSVNFTDQGADIKLSYRGPSNSVVREVCGELLEIFDRLNSGNGEDD